MTKKTITGKSVFSGGSSTIESICTLAPTTCSIVTGISSSFCPSCTSKWSFLGPKTHIIPHCGPSNARLRIHLGLQVANNHSILAHEYEYKDLMMIFFNKFSPFSTTIFYLFFIFNV